MTTLAIAEIISAFYAGLMLVGYLIWRDNSNCMKRLKMLSRLTIIWLLSDAFAYVFNEYEIKNKVVYVCIFACNLLAYVMSNVVLMGFLLYCEAYINEKIPLNKWVFGSPIIAIVINIVIDVVYFLNGHMIAFRDNHFVIVGTAPMFVLVSYMLVMFYPPGVAFVKRKYVGKKSIIFLASYGIPVIFSVLILMKTGLDLTVIAGSVSVIFTVSFMQRELTNRHIQSEAAHDAIAENNVRILTLEDKFEALYDVELQTGKYEMYMKGKTFEDIFKRLVNENNFFSDATRSIEVVYEDDRDDILKIFNKDYIVEKLSKDSQFDWFYRVKVGQKVLWSKLRIVYKNEDKNNVIIGFFNAEEEMNAKLLMEQQKQEWLKSRLRGDALSFVAEDDPNIEKFIEFFGERFLEFSECNKIIFKTNEGNIYSYETPGTRIFDTKACMNCPFDNCENPVPADENYIIVKDTAEGINNIKPNAGCPAKSFFKQTVYSEGRPVGVFTVYYLEAYHQSTDSGNEIMKSVAVYLGLLMGRKEAKRAERDKIEAEASNKAKTEFLFNMSHDIRTPMNAIIGFTNMAKKNMNNPDKLLDCIEKTQQSGDILLSLINSILDMSRIESGQVVLEEVAFDVRKSFKGIESIMTELADTKHIKLQFEIENVTDNLVLADYKRCIRVFINIITNAVKYTKEGGYVNVKCSQTGRRDDGYGLYCYTFEDNGIGMSEEFQKRVFDQFAREENSDTKDVQGTGLGLSVVKTFVDLMGGTVSCSSKQGEGTTFTLILPFKIKDEDLTEEYDTVGSASVVSKTDTEELMEIYRGKRVLVTEDNELNLEIATDVLEEVGLIVEYAMDGLEAINKIKEKGIDYFDFILMDIKMPVMGGYEATERIRSMYPGSNIPIIALSANAFEADRQASIEAGMNDHVAKPINPRELYAVLNKIFGL